MNATKTALYTALSGGTALTALLSGTTSIYDSQVPRGASFDCVVFQLQGGGDTNQTSHRAKNQLWTVKAVSETSAKQAGLIDAQIDALLHGQPLSVSGWSTYWMFREQDISFVEVTAEGRNLYHTGGVYRLRMAKT